MKCFKILSFSFLFSIIYFLPFVSSADITTGLVGYWNFDEGSGTVATDFSGNGNNGTLMNGPVWTVGKIGGALFFDGMDDYVETITGSKLNITNNLTLSAWIKKDNDSLGYIVGNNYQYILYNNSDGKLHSLFRQSDNVYKYPNSDYVLPLNSWQHVAVTFSDGVVNFYVNGSLAKTDTTSTTTNNLINRGQVPGIIGSYFNHQNTFSGIIDDVRVYNRVLAGIDVTELYNFTGSAIKPSATTNQTTDVSATSVTLNGTVDPNGGSSLNYYFQYGTVSGSLDKQTVVQSATAQLNTSTNITSLIPNTNYYYRIVADNGIDVVYGRELNLTTKTDTGTTYYVDPNGSDSNNGSINAPFRTIQKAANIVNPGNIIIVRNGVYIDNDGDGIVAKINRGGTTENWVTIKSENKWGAKIDGQNNLTEYGIDFAADYIRVENFEIFGIGYGAFWSNSNSKHIYIYGNHIHDIGRRCTDNENGQGLGIYQGTNTSHHTYDSNVIHDNGRFSNGENGCNNATHYWQNHDHGLYIAGSDTLIKNNIFYNLFHGWAIASGTWTSVNSDKIINNTFAFPNPNRDGHILVHAYNEGNFNTLIQNNIFYKPRGYAIRGYRESSSTSTIQGLIIRNNLVYGANLFENSSFMANPIIENNITEKDPNFLDIINYDFHLKYNSSAVDAGHSIDAPSYDHNNNSRPKIISYDIGAYEYVDQETPTVSTGLSVTASASQASLSWSTSTDNISISGYKIYRNGAEIATNQNTSYTDTNLSPNTTYSYQVSAYDSSGNESVKSASVTVTTQPSNSSSANNSGGSGGGAILGSINPLTSTTTASTTSAIITATTLPAMPKTSMEASQATTTTATSTAPTLISNEVSSTYYVNEKVFSNTQPIFTKPLKLNQTNSEIKQLQQFLSQDKSIYPEGLITGYYGNLTKKAVQRFQKKYGIVSEGSPETTGYGIVGPKTIAKLNEIYSKTKIQPSNQTPASSSGSSSSSSQNFSLRQLVELLIFTGVIAPDKADLARTSLKAIGM